MACNSVLSFTIHHSLREQSERNDSPRHLPESAVSRVIMVKSVGGGK